MINCPLELSCFRPGYREARATFLAAVRRLPASLRQSCGAHLHPQTGPQDTPLFCDWVWVGQSGTPERILVLISGTHGIEGFAGSAIQSDCLPLLREILRGLIEILKPQLGDMALDNRMDIYEQRDRIYLAALDQQELLYHTAADIIERHHICHGDDCSAALQALQLDKALCPRSGAEQRLRTSFNFDAHAVQRALAAMELPTTAAQRPADWTLGIHHPGGVGDILQGADGGSWLSGSIEYAEPGSFDTAGGEKPSELALVAIA